MAYGKIFIKKEIARRGVTLCNQHCSVYNLSSAIYTHWAIDQPVV